MINHKPGCAANTMCAVDHGGQPCPGPYGKCNCGADESYKTFNITDEGFEMIPKKKVDWQTGKEHIKAMFKKMGENSLDACLDAAYLAGLDDAKEGLCSNCKDANDLCENLHMSIFEMITLAKNAGKKESLNVAIDIVLEWRMNPNPDAVELISLLNAEWKKVVFPDKK